MTILYVDGDACPVREEVYRVAERLRLEVFVVANGSRPIRPPQRPNVHMVTVSEGADIADDWIADRVTAQDVCITADIPLAGRCLEKSARAISPKGHHWTPANIGNALAGREIARHMREIGMNTGGPAPLTKQDRSRFLSALDAAVQAALRVRPQAAPLPLREGLAEGSPEADFATPGPALDPFLQRGGETDTSTAHRTTSSAAIPPIRDDAP